jgi:hypothetical protein
VLIGDPCHLYRKLFLDDVAGMERFLSELCSPEWNLAQDAGRPWDEATRLLVRPTHARGNRRHAGSVSPWARHTGPPVKVGV